MTGSLDQVRLHIVTGKGGTGKTTVASALAVLLARSGRRVLLAEVEQRSGIEHVLGLSPLTYDETPIDHVVSGGQLSVVAIDARAALREYLDRYYKFGVAGKLVDRAGAVDFAASIAPGLRDLLLTGKLYEATRRTDSSGEPVYDAVVVDAPPTGRVTQFLNVSTEVSDLAKAGPVHDQAVSMRALLHSADTAVHLVTLPEEMPVTETLEAVHDVEAIGLAPGAIIVNQWHAPILTLTALRQAGKGSLEIDSVVEGLATAGVPDPDATAAALLTDAVEHSERIAQQRREEAKLAASGLPVVKLPFVNGEADAEQVHALADALAPTALGSGVAP